MNWRIALHGCILAGTLTMTVLLHVYVIEPTKPQTATARVANCTESISCTLTKAGRLCHTTVILTLFNVSDCATISRCCEETCADDFPPGSTVAYYLPCSADNNLYVGKLIGLWLPMSFFLCIYFSIFMISIEKQREVVVRTVA